ncbi:MAG TPA: outer membrane beta-barrel protein, partial [Burkholderiales bacterium]|nr:outer membrane beta-barrel protein [Burkholderiales bacterium]
DMYIGRARYKFGARWAATADFTRITIENDGDTVSVNDSETNTIGAGLRYYSTPTNHVTMIVRRTNGDYPNRDNPSAVNDTGYDQNDYGVEVDYLTGPWKLEGGVAYTQREYDNLSDRDYGGITANFSADWRITGKTGIKNSWRRYLRDIETSDATFILVNTFSVAPYWKVSDLVRVEMPLRYSTRDYEGDTTASGSTREDEYYHLGLQGTWRPTHNWHLALAYEHIRRTSNQEDRDFDANIASISAQFLF